MPINSLNRAPFPATRMRRLRAAEFTRRLVRETLLPPADLIYPMFVLEGKGVREPIASMPGIERVSLDILQEEARHLSGLGVPAIAILVKGKQVEAREYAVDRLEFLKALERAME